MNIIENDITKAMPLVFALLELLWGATLQSEHIDRLTHLISTSQWCHVGVDRIGSQLPPLTAIQGNYFALESMHIKTFKLY